MQHDVGATVRHPVAKDALAERILPEDAVHHILPDGGDQRVKPYPSQMPEPKSTRCYRVG